MAFREKLDTKRLLNGALIAGAIALAWKFEKRPAPSKAVVENDPSQPAADAFAAAPPPAPSQPPPAPSQMTSWAWWRDVLIETWNAMGKDRLLAVAAGVVFYALLALFPGLTAFVSFYGLFADPVTAQVHLAELAGVLPAGGIAILQEQVARITTTPGGLSVGFVVGLAIALWSANAGVKAMMDALNAIEGRDESRSFVRLNALSLSLTLGAIVFLLLAVGAVVAFPLAMSMLGLKALTATTTWLIRWPVLLALTVGALAVLYRFGPARDGPPRPWITTGTLIAALVWLAGSALLSFYLSNFADYNATYGSLGAAIGLMMWMWLSAIAVLLGAQIDTVIERQPLAPPLAPV